MMQQARKLVAAEWLPATLCCDLTFQLIKMLSEQARTALQGASAAWRPARCWMLLPALTTH